MTLQARGQTPSQKCDALAAALSRRALLEQGVRCYPRLVGTTTGDHIRLFHAGTVMGGFVDMLLHPSEETDRELAAAITKFKGKWDWGPVSRGLEPVTEEVAS